MSSSGPPFAKPAGRGRLTLSAPCSGNKCGYAAVDINDRSLGFFVSRAEAAAALQGLSLQGTQDGDLEPDLQ